MKVKRVLCFVSAVLLLALSLSGCAAGGAQKTDVDVREAFLTAFFTTNYGGRYDAFLEASAMPDRPTSADIEKITDAYYASVRELVSDEFYTTMLANRDIYQFDKLAYENNESMKPTGFAFTEYSASDHKTTYTFEATLEVMSGDQVRTGKISGQITVEDVGGKALVSNLYLSKTGIVYDAP